MKKPKVLFLKNFIIDKEKKSISGILFEPEKTLLSAQFISEKHPDINGFVWQAFQKDKERGIVNYPFGFKLKEGEWFGTISFTKGFEKIVSGKVKKFRLIENLTKKSNVVRRRLKRGQVYEKFVAINKPHELSSFKIEVRPGSKYGSGRNEHGKPHFHLIGKNSRNEIAKIEIPDINTWNGSNRKTEILNIINGSISKTQKKEIVNYFSKDDCENLIRIKSEWDKMNRDNNRVYK